MQNSAEIILFVQSLLWQGFIVLLRVGPIVALLPAFGEQTVPARIKLVVALSFAAIVAPAVPDAPIDGIFLTFAAETAIGLMLGVGIRLFVMALQTAGSIAAQATSLSQVFGGSAAEPLPAMGHILVVSALALAVMLGLHIRVAELMVWSYTPFPIGVFPNGSAISTWGISQVSQAFSLAFSLAAPFVIVSVLYNLTLGVINRAMPQLMVAFVGAPLITAGGLFLLFLLSPIMLSRWHSALSLFLANPLGQP